MEMEKEMFGKKCLLGQAEIMGHKVDSNIQTPFPLHTWPYSSCMSRRLLYGRNRDPLSDILCAVKGEVTRKASDSSTS